jgi:DNA invertase Pin-like site-specific DNA recombinase
MLIGYARVSTQDQNLELQTEALTQADCKKVFEDKVSGSRAERPGLAKAQEALREGDTLVVWKLDRLGRSVKNLVNLVGQLHQQGVWFKSLTDAIDTERHRDASSSTSWPAWLRWNANSRLNELAPASKSLANSDAKVAENDR